MSGTGLPHADSYYAATANPAPARAPLRGDIATDICIVGAGFTGLSAALHLAERGYAVTVLEANKVGWGASGRNGGQALVGVAAGVPEMRALLGEAWARQIWELSLAAVERQQALIRHHAIDCAYRPGYLQAAWKPRHLPAMQEELALIQGWGYDGARLLSAAEARAMVVGPRYAGGLYDDRSGHLHPLNYALGLAAAAEAAGARIHEDSAALGIDRAAALTVRTALGAVRCRQVVLAGNAYLNHVGSEIEDRVLPVGTYILATEPLDEARARALIPDDICVSDSKHILDYYRFSPDRRLIFGGRASRHSDDPRELADGLRRRMHGLFPRLGDIAAAHLWHGTVAITRNRLPHLGRLDGDIYFAQGYCGHGVALTTLVGQLVAEAIAGTNERFDVFARIPHRPFPGGRATALRLRNLATLWYRLLDAL
jgi:gamma-glutamylputrescine oxidase